ncbi:hypothetical protein Cni_G07173 [Canna indica]|uniref:Uncharacterized protein n=1 Tax=Canna indica TaxID=4628 RepID=A0AAQ3JYA7_9LILI|nr:hypothetical protein Cni_G07173 [Canna indica]
MGNAACRPNAIRVVNGDGSMEEFAYSVSVAQLIVESPGHFICDSINLIIGCRVPGLSADDKLKRRRLYFFLPMDMLFSVLTEEEMAALSSRASAATTKKKKKRRRALAFMNINIYVGRRIFPALLFRELCLVPAEAKRVRSGRPSEAPPRRRT